MKKQYTITLLTALLFLTHLNAQPLFTYGPFEVGRDEFLQAFRKNNTEGREDQAAYRKYLDLYIRYRLKVQGAYDMRLDTLPGQQAELQNLRNQVIGPYMTDESTVNWLVEEAIRHSRQDIRLSHIYIPIPENDTLLPAKRAREAYERLKRGEPFGQVARVYSADPAVGRNQGDIGWISSFTLPYELEKIVYSTPLNSISEPYRGKKAWHIFKPIAARPAAGIIQVAQILLELPPDADPAVTEKTRLLADSVYDVLKRGADFGQLAYALSADNSSFQNRGLLPPFKPGTYDSGFEEAAFALAGDEQVGRPFRTAQGFHILRRMRLYFEPDEKDRAAMRSRVLADARGQLAQEAVLERIKVLTGFQRKAFNKEAIAAGDILALISGREVSGAEYHAFLASRGIALAGHAQGQADLLEEFFKYRLQEEYRAGLEKYEPAFAAQLKEFRDGNLLFEAMQQKVWDRAAEDEAALQAHFSVNRNRYRWKQGVTAVRFSSMDSMALSKVYSGVKANPRDWKKIVAAANGQVQADSGRFEISELPLQGMGSIKPGQVGNPVKPAMEEGFSFVYVTGKMPQGSPRSFEEARGLVLADYQEKLESDWINGLRKTYPVKVNEKVLASLGR